MPYTGTKAFIGQGVLVQRGNADGPPETFTSLAEVSDHKGPGVKVSAEEATNQDSLNNTMEFIPGMIDPGELDVTLNFADGTAYKQLLADAVARSVHNYRILFPAAASGLGANH